MFVYISLSMFICVLLGICYQQKSLVHHSGLSGAEKSELKLSADQLHEFQRPALRSGIAGAATSTSRGRPIRTKLPLASAIFSPVDLKASLTRMYVTRLSKPRCVS